MRCSSSAASGRSRPDGTVGQDPWLDLTDEVLSGGERGLLGLAFHPGYPADPRFYFFYTRTSDHADVLAQMSVVNGVPDRSTEQVVLAIHDPFPNHNGGMLAFGHDGYLYIGTGDGGDADDPFRNGQNVHQLLGKILRIDVDGGQPYAIPADNPSNRGMDVSPEIWDWGMRNPWRFSFDHETGWLWIGDVGQDTTEEVDLEAPDTGGLNYGWNVMEGNAVLRLVRVRPEEVHAAAARLRARGQPLRGDRGIRRSRPDITRARGRLFLRRLLLGRDLGTRREQRRGRSPGRADGGRQERLHDHRVRTERERRRLRRRRRRHDLIAHGRIHPLAGQP